MAAPVRRSRRRRSVLRMSLVSARAGRRELDAERARVAMRTCAKDRAEARMAAGNPRSSAKRGSRRKELRRSGMGIFRERKKAPTRPGRMLKAREAPSAEQERLRLIMPRRRSTTRKKGSPHERWMVKSPGQKRAMSSSSLAGLRGNEESEREGDPSGRGEERTVGLEISEADEELARRRHDWLVAWCLVRPA